jgi:hypothetical protein
VGEGEQIDMAAAVMFILNDLFITCPTIFQAYLKRDIIVVFIFGVHIFQMCSLQFCLHHFIYCR